MIVIMIGTWSLQIPPQTREGMGVLAGQGKLLVSPVPTYDVSVRLTSGDIRLTAQLAIPKASV